MDDLVYYEGLEKLINEMSNPNGFSLENITSVLSGLFLNLKVCKSEVELTVSESLMVAGKGERISFLDDGSEPDCSLTEELQLPGKVTAHCTIAHKAGADAWTEMEKSRIMTIMRMVVSNASRGHLERLVNDLTYLDEQGYNNFRYFTKCVREIKPEHIGDYAAIRFNIKHFGLINQDIGRDSGSVVMRRYIDTIEESGGEGCFVSRLDDDNFVMMCNLDYLGNVAGNLEGTRVPFGDGEQINVSAYAGVYMINEGPSAFTEIMEAVTDAFNVARSGIQGDIVFYDAFLKKDHEKTLRVKKLFPIALQNEEIHIFYQPKINVQTNQLIGAEALSRWFHDGEIVFPEDFIPILEQSMEVCKLDFYVLEHVCRDIRRWMDEGRKVVRISVNMSRRHMIRDDLLERILDIIDMYDVPHEYIEIELTETTSDVGFRRVKELVDGLQSEGIYAAVDDFGIGYSSLNLIRDISWNVIKVDKCFVPLDTENSESTRKVMFKNVVHMLNEMGTECVAEGVETREQVQILRENGCLVAQGYYFDKPLPVPEFEKRMDMGFYPE